MCRAHPLKQLAAVAASGLLTSLLVALPASASVEFSSVEFAEGTQASSPLKLSFSVKGMEIRPAGETSSLNPVL